MCYIYLLILKKITKEIYSNELNISLLVYLLISFEIINNGDLIIVYYLQDVEYTPLALQYVVQVYVKDCTVIFTGSIPILNFPVNVFLTYAL